LRGEQIALRALDDESHGIVVEFDLHGLRARAQPLRQAGHFHGPYRQPRTDGVESLHPRGVVLLAFEFAGEHQVDIVRARVLQQRDDGVATAHTRLAGRQAQLDQFARTEQ
jgi:hypothetical protein